MSLFLEKLRLEPTAFFLSNSMIKVFGPDAQSYLHSQSTNSVTELKENEFQFNSILDLSGRIISAFILCKKSDLEFYIILNEENIPITIERIEKFHISEDFEVEMISQPVSLLTKTSPQNENNFKGRYFFEDDQIIFGKSQENLTDFNILKILSGVPELGSEVNHLELINNTFFDELAVNYQKGCYPGQETVAKIDSRRGAAFKAILIEVSGENSFGKDAIFRNSKKIGEIRNSVCIDDKTFIYASLNRENRIDGIKIDFEVGAKSYSGKTHYYPYLRPEKTQLAIDLYDHAIELFHQNNYDQAKQYFKKSIAVDPFLEDAYESLGVLYGRLSEYDKAIKVMSELKEINPKCMMAYTNLSLFHMKVGEIDTAEEYKSEATLLNFQLLGDVAAEKEKKSALEKRKAAEALNREKMFLQVLEMDDKDAMANNGMGEIMYERKKFSEAESYFKRAISADKKYSVAYLGLAKTLSESNNTIELQNVLDEGILIASKNGDLMPANEMQALKVSLNK